MSGIFLLTHVTTRVALLVQGEAIEHVDVAVTQPCPYSVSGGIAVFTEHLLALVALHDVQTQVTTHDGTVPGDVEVVVVPRRPLLRMTIDKADGDKNYNKGWMGSSPMWPAYGHLRLTYPGLREDVILGPRRSGYDEVNEEVNDFLPSLVADLAAR